MNTQERTLPIAIVALIAIAMAIAAIALASDLGVLSGGDVQATHVDPTPQEGNPTCSDFQGSQTWTELKIDDEAPFNWDGLNGTFSDGALSVTITGITTAFQPPFNWSSNIGVDAVFVKGGNVGGFLYLYDPEATSDTGLTTPNNQSGQPADISHISFCYDEEEPTPTPTPTPTSTSTSTPTSTSTSTPTPTSTSTSTPTPTSTSTSTPTPTSTSTSTPTPTSTSTPTPTSTSTATPTPTSTSTSTPTPTSTSTSTPTPTATPAVLGEVQAPASLPDTGGSPEKATVSSLSLLLGLAGLALLSGAGTLVAVAARRRR